mgnify:CR=1 FL=1
MLNRFLKEAGVAIDKAYCFHGGRLVDERPAKRVRSFPWAENKQLTGFSLGSTASMQRDLGAGLPSELEDQVGAVVRLAREDGRLVSAVAFEDDGRFDGINDRSQMAAAEWKAT